MIVFLRRLGIDYYIDHGFFLFFSQNAYDVNIKIEAQALITYSKYTKYHRTDHKKITQYELNHHQELNKSLSMLTSI